MPRGQKALWGGVGSRLELTVRARAGVCRCGAVVGVLGVWGVGGIASHTHASVGGLSEWHGRSFHVKRRSGLGRWSAACSPSR
eukprot:1430455-Alexandrium_andersonii.AAC.1